MRAALKYRFIQLHLAAAIVLNSTPLLAQTPYTSASGATAIGFSRQDFVSDVPADGRDAATRCAIQIDPSFAGLIDEMLRASSTFRRQCARLAAASSRVLIRLDLGGPILGVKASTVMARGARLEAHVRVRPADADTVTFLAHELEHILEQLDDINLAFALASGLRGVRESEPDVFETARAIAIGQAVGREVHEYRRR